MPIGRWLRSSSWAAVITLGVGALAAIPEYTRMQEHDAEAREGLDRMFEGASAYFQEEHVSRGATDFISAGGAQDIAFARRRATDSSLVAIDAITDEGLFSEYDLPLPPTGPCGETLCLATQATAANLLARPDVDYLAQVGFTSDRPAGLRDPLHAVIVVDRSGSMDGDPARTSEVAVETLLAQLGPHDRASLVTFSDDTELRVERSGDMPRVARMLRGTRVGGSTAMEAGLELGYRTAQRGAEYFEGETRVFLFTDERPNVGATGASAFITAVSDAANDGIGTTTIGLSGHFDPELAVAISSIRGGNLHYVPDQARARELFGRELNSMVNEVAHDLQLEVVPAEGVRVVDVFGIPGDRAWLSPEGELAIGVPSVFTSRRSGAIVVALSREDETETHEGQIAVVRNRYADRSGRHEEEVIVRPVSYAKASDGLQRAVVLTDEYAALRLARDFWRTDRSCSQRVLEAAAHRVATSPEPFPRERRLVCSLLAGTGARDESCGEPPDRRARQELRSCLGHEVVSRSELRTLGQPPSSPEVETGSSFLDLLIERMFTHLSFAWLVVAFLLALLAVEGLAGLRRFK